MKLSVDLHTSGVAEWLIDAVNRLARADPQGAEAYLCSIGQPLKLDQTRATVRTHFILKDANGNPRIQALSKKLANQVIDYCIPRSRIKEAKRYYDTTGSTERFAQLDTEAKSLFTTLARSGEGGELLLYFLLEVVLRIPQILCKMPLKTSSQMHIHGTDGLHAKVLNNGDVALYWAESKMHASVTSAIDDCFKSLAPYLVGERSPTRDRDLLLVRDHLDLGSEEVTQALIRYFIDDRPEAARVEFRGACLVGFSMFNYPSPFEEDGESVRAEIAQAMAKWHDRVLSRINAHELESFEIEVFCLPVPSVDDFRAALRHNLGLT